MWSIVYRSYCYIVIERTHLELKCRESAFSTSTYELKSELQLAFGIVAGVVGIAAVAVSSHNVVVMHQHTQAQFPFEIFHSF
jgi:hypothetical protein